MERIVVTVETIEGCLGGESLVLQRGIRPSIRETHCWL